MAGSAKKYQSIQLLRALAAVMVLVFHSKIAIWPREARASLLWIPGFSDFGDLGVCLFSSFRASSLPVSYPALILS